MRAIIRYTLPILLILVVGLFVLYLLFGRPAPTPEVFSEALTMEQARERSVDLDKPMLVFATADWCIPCQFMKRRAMSDERVASMIGEKMIPVYLDVTNSRDEVVMQHADQLNVRSLPSLIVIRGDEELGRIEGDVPAVELLSWLGTF